MDIEAIDAFAFAFLYIQWLTYGTSDQYQPLKQWPGKVLQLQKHCNRYVDDLHDLSEVVNNILQNMPYQWKAKDYYFPELRHAVTAMWKAAFKSTGFISEDLYVQIMWYWCLNHYAEDNELLCKFIVQGIKTQTRRFVYQPQGRMKSTRYKNVSAKRLWIDKQLRDEIAGKRAC